jgi:hypothetical protein
LVYPEPRLPDNLPAAAEARARFAVLLDEVLTKQAHVPFGDVRLVGGQQVGFSFDGVPTVVQSLYLGPPQLIPPLYPGMPTKGRPDPGAPK